jgi:hypothetical protein
LAAFSVSYSIHRPNIIRMIKTEENEMDRACSTNGGVEECIWDIGGKARREETTGKTKT